MKGFEFDKERKGQRPTAYFSCKKIADRRLSNTLSNISPFVKILTQTLFLAMFTTLLLHYSLSPDRPSSFLGVPPPGGPSSPPPRRPSSSAASMAPERVHALVFLSLISFLYAAASFPEPDAQILLKFKDSLRNTTALSDWGVARPPCNVAGRGAWAGVLCDQKGKVWGLRLEKMGLGGIVDVDALTKLESLRTISIMNNNFEGPLPNFSRLSALKTVYLSHNKFSREIGERTFAGMQSLKKLHLADNKLSGSIPSTLAELPRLMELILDRNELEGEIPEFALIRLREFNVSHNKLSGEIPQSLRTFNASLFSGNKELCGPPLNSCPPPNQTPSPVPSPSSSHGSPQLSVGTIIVVVVLVLLALTSLVVAILVLLRRRKRSRQPDQLGAAPAGGDLEQGQAAAGTSSSSPETLKQNAKLTFLKECCKKFDMSDLLKASAEHLGGGMFCNSYKAALDDGKVMVVKRFKHMNNVGREEFNEHMRRLGRLSHENVLPVLAFFYRKEEKLLVADYAVNLSLDVQLHGNRSAALDWSTRLNIVKGVAKGLQYLYNELPSLTAPHGHLKSSNVLLDRSFRPLLTDYGLVPIVNQDYAQEHMISYKSPEYKDRRQITKKTDVWSLGILILEVLTGRYPSNLLEQENGGDVDLATWVESVVCNDGQDDGSVEALLDKNMAGKSNCLGEVMKLLKIGLSCCQAEAEAARPDIREVVEKIDEIKGKDVDDEFYSSYSSEADIRSSRGLSDDFMTINI